MLHTNLARTTADILANAYAQVENLNSVGEDASAIELDDFLQRLAIAAGGDVSQQTVMDICETLSDNGVLTGAGILGALAYAR